MHVVGTHSAKNAARPRISSRAPNERITSPVLLNSTGSLSQIGSVAASTSPVRARLAGSARSP
jgi:hypothetical protein